MIVTGLPSGPSAVSPKALAYLRPSWKTWPSSMPREIVERRAAARAAIAVADLDRADLAVRHEVAAAHDEGGVLVRRRWRR